MSEYISKEALIKELADISKSSKTSQIKKEEQK